MKPTIHVLVGSDPFLKDRYVQRQRQKVPDWISEELAGKETTCSGLRTLLDSVSFGVQGRVILVTEAEKIKARRGTNVGEALVELAAAVPEDTLLVLRGSDATWKKDTEPLSHLDGKKQAGGAIVRFFVLEPPKTWDGGAEVAAWAVREAGELGHALDRTAAQELVNLAGCDLRTLSNELLKLSAYVGEKVPIDLLAVRVACARSGVQPPYEVAERALAGDLRGALDRFQRSKSPDGSYHLGVVGSLLANLERVLVIHDLLATGVGEEGLAERLGAHPYVVKKVHIPTSRRYSVSATIGLLRRLCEADLSLKSTVPSKDAVVESLLVAVAAAAKLA